jgi:hypothetical protein
MNTRCRHHVRSTTPLEAPLLLRVRHIPKAVRSDPDASLFAMPNTTAHFHLNIGRSCAAHKRSIARGVQQQSP